MIDLKIMMKTEFDKMREQARAEKRGRIRDRASRMIWVTFQREFGLPLINSITGEEHVLHLSLCGSENNVAILCG